MTEERFVVLALAAPGTAWAIALTGWADSGSVPVELVRCVSGEETRARLGTGRPFSALLADGALADLDRDLLGAAARSGCPVVVVQGERVRRDWIALGATDVLDPAFGPLDLVEVLTGCSDPIGGRDTAPARRAGDGLLVAVVGPGGTGASTAATALAQALAGAAPACVVLADFSRWADLGLLHGVPEESSGVQELVDAHRVGMPTDEDVVALTAAVPGGYRVLPGLRRARHWAAIRPRAFEAALASLTRAFPVVVCDVDPDLEGEDDGGSIDVEERNAMSRLSVQAADVVLAVAEPSRKGLHRLARLIEDLRAVGVDAASVVTVLNRVRDPDASRPAAAMPGAVVLAELDLEQAFGADRPLPVELGEKLAGAVGQVAATRLRRAAWPAEHARRVKPGALGTTPSHLDDGTPFGGPAPGPDEAIEAQVPASRTVDPIAAPAPRLASAGRLRPDLELQAALLDTARHPGVVQLRGISETGLVIAPVPGRVLTVGMLDSVGEVAAVVAALASTVADLHDLGIAHGAIAAEAVVIGTDGRPVLGAFEHATWAADDADLAPDLAAVHSLLGALLEPFGGPTVLDALALNAPSARAFGAALLEAVPEARLPGPTAALSPTPTEPGSPRRRGRRGGRRGRRLEDAAPPHRPGDGPKA